MKRFVAKASCPECRANGEMQIAANSGRRAKNIAGEFHNRERYIVGSGERDPDAECGGKLNCSGVNVIIEGTEDVGEQFISCMGDL